MPMPPEVDPRVVFDRLFPAEQPGETPESRAALLRERKSVLDFVTEDARRLKRKLGYTDRRKLDEYLTAVREVELRIQRTKEPPAAPADFPRPAGRPSDREEHMHLLLDLLVLALQTDSTRIATYILAHDGDNNAYPAIGVSEGHHDLSHHGNDETKKEKIARINRYHITQLAYFLGKLKSIQEGERNLLDNCMIVYGAGISDGNRHNHDNLPILLAGHGSGTLRAGRHVRFHGEVPMTNLYLSMLERMGVAAERVGDSTGKLDDI